MGATERKRRRVLIVVSAWCPAMLADMQRARLLAWELPKVGWDVEGRFHATLAAQVRQALENVTAVLAEAGGRPEHLVRLTWYVTSRDDYYAELPGIGAAYRAVIGRHYPAMSVVQVVALMEAAAKVEIEATAVIPDPA